MFIAKGGVRLIATARAVGALMGAAAARSAARPTRLTAAQITFVHAVYGNFPGYDDQLLLAGVQACRQLCTGQPTSAVIGATATQYGCGR